MTVSVPPYLGTAASAAVPIPLESVPLPPELLGPAGERDLAAIMPVYRVGVAVVLCYAIFKLGHVVSSRLSPAYAGLPPSEQLRWNLRIVSLVHAATSSAAGFRIFHHDHQLWEDPIAGWSGLCYFMSPWTWGYMLFDLAMTCWHYTVALENPAIIAHHLYILMGGILYWLYAPVAWGYCCNLMVTELSTIFLHINAFFLMSKAASGKAFVGNGLLLLLTFTHRMIVSLYLTYWLYSVGHEITYNFLFYGSVILGLMNLTWYYALVMRVVEHFFPWLVKVPEGKKLY